jgi:Flp pilus assembly protein TadB
VKKTQGHISKEALVVLVVIIELGLIFVVLLGVPSLVFFLVLIAIAAFVLLEEWSRRKEKRLRKKSKMRPKDTSG